MRCRDYEKWVSDSLDGVMRDEQRARLEAHLKKCPSCQAYSARLTRIHQEAASSRKAAVAPSYWEELSSAVRRRIEATEKSPRHLRPAWWSWRWAWGGVVLFSAVVFSLLLRPRPNPAFQSDVFTFEACLGRLNQEIEDDAELAGNFNLVLLSSLRKDLSPAILEENPVFSEDPLFWESLSEEEWRILEEILTKELKS